MILCDTCKRRPSERFGRPLHKPGMSSVHNRPLVACPDPLHDLADRCVELEAEIDLRDSAIASEGTDEGVRQLAAADQVIVGLEADLEAEKTRCRALIKSSDSWRNEVTALKARVAELEAT